MIEFDRQPRRNAAIPLLVLILGACTVGPNYERPGPPVQLPEQFYEAEQKADTFATVDSGHDLWASFNDPVLDGLIDRALAENRNIAQVAARMEEIRSLSGLTLYSLFPTVTAQASGERSKFAEADPFVFPGLGITEVYRAGFDAAWEIDLFGGLRRQSDAIYRRVEAEQAALGNARLSVVAEVAQAYFSLRGSNHRLALLKKNLERQRATVEILVQSEQAGRGTGLDVSRAEVLARTVAAQVPQAQAAVARARQRLAVLTVVSAAEIESMTSGLAELPSAPSLVAVGTPDQWLRRRPDIIAAERQLAAATSDVGVEIANYFPKLNLLGSFGWTSSSVSGLGDSQAERWSLGPTIDWQFLNVGRVRRQVMAAEARARGALAQYDQAVLLALEETETALANFRAATETVAQLDGALIASRDAERLAGIRFDGGASDYLTVLDAERTQLEIEDQWVLARTDQMTAVAALYKALAGDFATVKP